MNKIELKTNLLGKRYLNIDTINFNNISNLSINRDLSSKVKINLEFSCDEVDDKYIRRTFEFNETQYRVWKNYLNGKSFKYNCKIGSGKTTVLMEIAKDAAEKGRQVFVIVKHFQNKKYLKKNLGNLSHRIHILTENEINIFSIRGYAPEVILVDEIPNFDWSLIINERKTMRNRNYQSINLYSEDTYLKELH